MNSSLARYLRDFGAESAPAAVHFEAPPPVEIEPDFPAVEHAVVQVDLEVERQIAYDEGFQAATEQLAADHAAALAELQEKHAADMEAQREEFEGGVADYLAKALPELTERVSAELAEAAIRLLAPILKSQMDREAVTELAEQMKPFLAKETLEQIQVHGPEHLCDLLREKLEDAAGAVECHLSDGPDVRVELGDTLLVTRLSAFAADLERVLA
jgi:hypothetical protein